MVSVTIKTPGKPTISLDFPEKHPDKVTVLDLKRGIHAKFPKLTLHRQRLTLPVAPDAKDAVGRPAKPTVLSEDTWSLGSYGIPHSGGEIRCKDLGAQVAWKGVFLAEYVNAQEHAASPRNADVDRSAMQFGPIIIHPLLYYASTRYGVGLPWVLTKLGLPTLGLGAPAPFEASALQKCVVPLMIDRGSCSCMPTPSGLCSAWLLLTSSSASTRRSSSTAFRTRLCHSETSSRSEQSATVLE